MPHQFKTLVFDVDGTLVDSVGLISRSIQAACADLGLQVPDDQKARHVIGMGLVDALDWIAPGIDDAVARKVADRYRAHYRAGENQYLLFDGVAESIPKLHAAGFILGIATGKSRRGLDAVLDQTGLRQWFHATRCADEVPFGKPHPHMLNAVMTVVGALPEETLMIGDTSHDLLMAHNAGTASLGVTYGAHPLNNLRDCQPLAIFDHYQDLHTWLMQNA